jgi:hypothetical protein
MLKKNPDLSIVELEPQPRLESLVATLGASFPRSAAKVRPMGCIDTLPSCKIPGVNYSFI